MYIAVELAHSFKTNNKLIEALNFAGPLPNTVNDFWWLVWQERVHVVAMVTNTVERGQQKCEQYWPDEGTKKYGPFKVTLAEQQVFADYTIRQLFVSVSLMILQYTFSALIHHQLITLPCDTICYSCFQLHFGSYQVV